MMYKIKRIKKGITITSVALAILSTLIAVILLLGKGSNTAVVAHAADEKFKPVIEGCKLSDTDNEDLSDLSSISIGFRASFETWNKYYFNGKCMPPCLVVVGACGYGHVIGMYSWEDQVDEFNEENYNENVTRYIQLSADTTFSHSFLNPGPATGEESALLIGKNYIANVQSAINIGLDNSDLPDRITFSVQKFVKEALLTCTDELSEVAIRKYNIIAGNDEKSTDTTVIVKYKQMNGYATTVDKSLRFEIPWYEALRRDYIAESMYKMRVQKDNGEYVSGLPSFNAVYKDVKVFDDGTTGLISERIYLQANGFDHLYDEGTNTVTLTVKYKDFSYKDFSILVQNNDSTNPLKIYIYTSSVRTSGANTILTFNYKTISEQLKNSASWLVAINKDNFTVFGSGDGVVVDVGTDELTVTFTDESTLSDIGITATAEIVEDVDVSITYKYKKIDFDGGQPIFEELVSSPIVIRYSELLNLNNERFYNSYGEIIDAAIDSKIDNVKFAEYGGIKQGAYNASTNSVVITVLYNYFSALKIVDVSDSLLVYKQIENQKVNYRGKELGFVIPSGYRVQEITSVNGGASIYNDIENFANTTVRITEDVNNAKVFILKVEFTDKWFVQVKYLEEYKQTPFAVYAEREEEVSIGEVNDFYNITADQIAKILGRESMNILSSTIESIDVTFDNICTYTIVLKYTFVSLMRIDYNGERQEVRVPLTTYAESREIAGINWSIMTLNRSDGTAKYFNYPNDVAEDKLYGYFAVVTFKEHISDINYVFRNDTGDGLKVLYKSKKITGSDFYKWNMSKKGTFFGGVASILAGIGEIVNDKNALYESYFFYMDNGSGFISNGGATSADDTDSSLKNFGQRLKKDIEDFFSDLWSKLTGNKKLMFAFWLVIGILLYAGLTWLFTKMGLMNGFFKYFWIAVALAGIITALYFGITIFA